ncbi:hypothetical protein ASE21_07615 [Flavobacterium sp. Root901]|nr:hypothetical protein ASE21_07615 [Flavobacterium sp. Root901]
MPYFNSNFKKIIEKTSCFIKNPQKGTILQPTVIFYSVRNLRCFHEGYKKNSQEVKNKILNTILRI